MDFTFANLPGWQLRCRSLGFHNHSNAEDVESFCRPGLWGQAFFYSDWNYANVDIGHFCAGNSVSPAQFIRLYHDRITNLHLKDRKFNQGPNIPWGGGELRFHGDHRTGVSYARRVGRHDRTEEMRRVLQGCARLNRAAGKQIA